MANVRRLYVVVQGPSPVVVHPTDLLRGQESRRLGSRVADSVSVGVGKLGVAGTSTSSTLLCLGDGVGKRGVSSSK